MVWKAHHKLSLHTATSNAHQIRERKLSPFGGAFIKKEEGKTSQKN
jgi:hypothetical protein